MIARPGEAGAVRSRAAVVVPRGLARRGLAALVAVGAVALGVSPEGRPGISAAQAAVVYELVPSASLGVTTNALLTPVAERDEFSVLGLGAGVRADGARSLYTLGYRLSYTHFFEHHGIETVSNALLGSGLFHPSARVDLEFTAGAAVSRVSRIDLGTLTAVTPVATPATQSYYLATNAGEELTFRPKAQYVFGQGLVYTQLDYLGSSPGLFGTRTITARGHADFVAARDTLSLSASVMDLFSTDPADAAMGATGLSQSFLATFSADWHRLVSPALTTDLAGGVAITFTSAGETRYSPTALAAVSYTRQLWFATASVSQTQVPNLFLGATTINDQALARLALPLTRRELVVISGFGSYLYARSSDEPFGLERVYDLRSAGAVLSAHFARLPFWGALEYTYLDQHGNSGTTQPAPSVQRQTVILSVGGAFSWGPGTPPLFHGGI